MPILSINLLRREQSHVSRLSQATVIVGAVSGSIVVLMLLVVVFLYTTIAIRSGQKDGLVQEQQEYAKKAKSISTFDQTFYPAMDLAQQAKAYQQQVDGLKSLIDNHRYFTLYLSEIAVNTPTTVVYQSFASESSDQLTISGQAKRYSDVSKLAKKFEGLSFAKSVSIQDAKLERGKRGFPIQFTLVIELKSAAELKKLPGPDRPGQRKRSSGAPLPRPTGSPAAGAPPAGHNTGPATGAPPLGGS